MRKRLNRLKYTIDGEFYLPSEEELHERAVNLGKADAVRELVTYCWEQDMDESSIFKTLGCSEDSVYMCESWLMHIAEKYDDEGKAITASLDASEWDDVLEQMSKEHERVVSTFISTISDKLRITFDGESCLPSLDGARDRLNKLADAEAKRQLISSCLSKNEDESAIIDMLGVSEDSVYMCEAWIKYLGICYQDGFLIGYNEGLIKAYYEELHMPIEEIAKKLNITEDTVHAVIGRLQKKKEK